MWSRGLPSHLSSQPRETVFLECSGWQDPRPHSGQVSWPLGPPHHRGHPGLGSTRCPEWRCTPRSPTRTLTALLGRLDTWLPSPQLSMENMTPWAPVRLPPPPHTCTNIHLQIFLKTPRPGTTEQVGAGVESPTETTAVQPEPSCICTGGEGRLVQGQLLVRRIPDHSPPCPGHPSRRTHPEGPGPQGASQRAAWWKGPPVSLAGHPRTKPLAHSQVPPTPQLQPALPLRAHPASNLCPRCAQNRGCPLHGRHVHFQATAPWWGHPHPGPETLRACPKWPP